MSYRLLLVEGVRFPSVPIRSRLAEEGHDVFELEPDHLAVQRVLETQPHLLLLPVLLNGVDGLALLRQLRATPATCDLPIIMVGDRGREEDALEALAQYADDYVRTPFDPRELAARAKAVLRRRYKTDTLPAEPVLIGDIRLDPQRYDCRVRGRRIPLRPLEFALLHTLMLKAGRFLQRGYLLETVWHSDPRATTRAVDVMVSRVRKKLGIRAGRRIETVRGMGYRFLPPEAGR